MAVKKRFNREQLHDREQARKDHQRLMRLNPEPLTVARAFEEAGLVCHGPVEWGEAVPASSQGIYIVALIPDPSQVCSLSDVSYLPAPERQKWINGQPIVYIGRTRRTLARRLLEFYQHEYGNRAPHRGGQAIKLLRCQLWVYWSDTGNPKEAEEVLLSAFRRYTGGLLPFGNRRREGRRP